MEIKNYAKNLIESVGSATEKLRTFVKDQFGGKNPTMGKIYLMKSPRGRPMLFFTSKIVKGSSTFSFAELKWGKVVEGGQNTEEWFLDWINISSTNKESHGALQVVTSETAAKMLKDIGISADKIPKGGEFNAKPVQYEKI